MKKCKKLIVSLLSAALLFALCGALCLVSAEEDEVTPWMFYSFDDGTGTDSGTAKNDAIAIGTPVFGTKTEDEAGPQGKYLNVSSEGYFVASADAFNFGTDGFTVSFWVKFSAEHELNKMERFFQSGLWGEGDTGFVIALNRDGNGYASINAAVAGTGSGNDFAGTWGASSFELDYFDGCWHLITVSFDQPNKKYYMYIDGNEVAVKGFDRENLSANTNRQNVGIGVFQLDDGSLPTGVPNYALDDVAFYKSVLTAEQVLAYYNANKGNTQTYDPDAEATLEDVLTGISVTGIGLAGADLYTSTIMSGDVFEQLSEDYNGFDNFILYDVSLERDNLPIELTENVTVSISVPDKLADKTGLKIVIAGEDGSLNIVNSQLIDSKLVFETQTLGQIAIVYPDSASGGDDIPNTGDGLGILLALTALAGAGILTFVKTARKCR